jgi:hypothetical protein
MRCPICEKEIIIGQCLENLKRVDGKIICTPCLTTLQAIKKMSETTGVMIWNGIRLNCEPYSIFKNRSIWQIKEKK